MLSCRISPLAQALLLTLFHGAVEEWAEIKPVRSEAPGFGRRRSNETNFLMDRTELGRRDVSSFKLRFLIVVSKIHEEGCKVGAFGGEVLLSREDRGDAEMWK